MKTTSKFAGFVVLAAGLAAGGCQKQSTQSLWKSVNNPAITDQLKSFISEKQAQADSAGGDSMPGFTSFMAAAQQGDRAAVRNLGGQIEKQAQQSYSDPRWHTARMQTVKELIGTFDAFGDNDAKYSAIYGNEIIQSIPAGSIYFGGTDPGRFIITAMQTSQIKGDPFFTLTQNALADGSYLDYLQGMYGDKIYIPTKDDSQKCFEDYYADVQQRMKENKLEPGENASVDPISGKMQVSGQVAVMNINALLVKVIFDRSTNREFYIEQSFPLAWMYPYLEPHGLIFKLNRQPLPVLSDETIQRDHDHWTNTVAPMIGDWLNDSTTVNEISAFAEKVFHQYDFSGFKGDPDFVKSHYSHSMFSKERTSIAALYAWRAQNTTDPGEKDRMNDAADFAYRQAWALCPYMPEAVYGYVQLLMTEERSSDALIVAETAEKLAPDRPQAEQLDQLVEQLKRYQNR
jgi:hypothetical protein